jgi:hypothetical protein
VAPPAPRPLSPQPPRRLQAAAPRRRARPPRAPARAVEAIERTGVISAVQPGVASDFGGRAVLYRWLALLGAEYRPQAPLAHFSDLQNPERYAVQCVELASRVNPWLAFCFGGAATSRSGSRTATVRS